MFLPMAIKLLQHHLFRGCPLAFKSLFDLCQESVGHVCTIYVQFFYQEDTALQRELENPLPFCFGRLDKIAVNSLFSKDLQCNWMDMEFSFQKAFSYI